MGSFESSGPSGALLALSLAALFLVLSSQGNMISCPPSFTLFFQSITRLVKVVLLCTGFGPRRVSRIGIRAVALEVFDQRAIRKCAFADLLWDRHAESSSQAF